jgi:transcriptional regulator with XRE-family HTH domain
MSRWRSLEEYTPIARLLVEYMWSQRPPLLPSQFAEQMGIPKQAVSRWLSAQADPDPGHLARIARRTPLRLSDLFLTAGYTTPDYPIFDRTGAWDEVLATVREAATIPDDQRALILATLESLRSAQSPPAKASSSDAPDTADAGREDEED